MALGWYTDQFESAVSPWTTFGPLIFVVSVSLLVEGAADRKRHRSDDLTNNFPCVILRRSEDIDADEDSQRCPQVLGGKDVVVGLAKSYAQTSKNGPQTPAATALTNKVSVGFQTVRRMDIRQGHLILVKNREMVPADMVLLASSGDNGSAYIETSSIDGETNLKLRTSPHLPKKVLKHLRDGTPTDFATEAFDEGPGDIETLEQATKRITRFSCLAYPDGLSSLKNPTYKNAGDAKESEPSKRSLLDNMKYMQSTRSPVYSGSARNIDGTHYVAALTSEPPNPHVNTFSGKLTLPPIEDQGGCFDIPLGAENLLLRGAVLRNTEWAIGLSCFTGTDTKLVQNAFDAPSKFSQLDILMNNTVVLIILLMIFMISSLATQSVLANDSDFDNLWYIGLKKQNSTEDTWPYLADLGALEWETTTPNWIQMFFLYVTLLSNLVPLSMYVTVEAINFFFLYLIYADIDMYDAKTDTRALARSTNVTDLGRVQYVFSDKTGTLTQNVMRFKRCSVDGFIFGAPIRKARPGASEGDENEDPQSSFHPTRHILVGRVDAGGGRVTSPDGELTFNSEMFLRVMSLCHTVVVEKDLDLSGGIDAAESVAGSSMSRRRSKIVKPGNRGRTSSDISLNSAGLEPLAEDAVIIGSIPGDGNRGRAASAGSLHVPESMEKGPDGAPVGYAYQAESPDEGALVSEASRTFGFQVVGRDSSGIKLRCAHPTFLTDQSVVDGIKSGVITNKKLAASTASGMSPTPETNDEELEEHLMDPQMQRLETWSILAVNKFDSERKRMSILLRSPPELGNIPMVFCKGADSAMLDPAVCTGAENLVSPEGEEPQRLQSVSEDPDTSAENDWEVAQMLGIQSHLGEFASEGLRTLVLGIRFLTEGECSTWLEQYKAAATSIKNRDQLLKEAAYKLETKIHIVGATAIEDKLQVGVPRTIATLAKAGIKLWVLTGDKRETAIEIGYSTNVLTSKMHLTEVADNGGNFVRAQCAMEFIRLVKHGKLPSYQRAAVDQSDGACSWENFMFTLGKMKRASFRAFRTFVVNVRLFIGKLLGSDPAFLRGVAATIKSEAEAEKDILRDLVRRRRVRDRAEKIIHEFLKSPEGQIYRRQNRVGQPSSDDEFDVNLSADTVPSVFGRAKSARKLLQNKKSEGRLVSTEVRNLSLVQLTAQSAEEEDRPWFDEDTLSLQSFIPGAGDVENDFDRKRRTIFERLFAVDKTVRKGRLVKHLKKEKRKEVLELQREPRPHLEDNSEQQTGDGPRALVIEGAALKHMLGDSELEEIVFSIASKCDAVIACRVSPRQKALLVKLVRHNVVPEPVTLAIGDGANDVGMIQEAHVGVGISGKEGKQAVNASDFAIAQFRFLETLVLIHGRWDFFRLSVVVLFSFYKNAVMAGILIVYNGETLFSGTPIFDEWVISVLNFVASFPIFFLGLFDRCLEKDYIRENPEVFQATRQNELITIRTFIRWVVTTFGHIFCLYYGSLYSLSQAGGTTSAFMGLMQRKEDRVGDGEGGDIQSVGTVMFTCMIILLAYKVSISQTV